MRKDKWDFSAVFFSSVRTATTDSRDENLKAKTGAAAGESEEERQRERLSEPTRSILDAPDAAIQSVSLSSRCHGDEPNGSPISEFASGEYEMC